MVLKDITLAFHFYIHVSGKEFHAGLPDCRSSQGGHVKWTVCLVSLGTGFSSSSRWPYETVFSFFLLLCYLHSEWLFPGSLRVIVSHPLLYFKLYHGSTSLFSIEGWNLSGIHLHFPLSMPPSARWPGWQGCVPVPVPCPERRK